jgi:hypothetical protein
VESRFGRASSAVGRRCGRQRAAAIQVPVGEGDAEIILAQLPGALSVVGGGARGGHGACSSGEGAALRLALGMCGSTLGGDVLPLAVVQPPLPQVAAAAGVRVGESSAVGFTHPPSSSLPLLL